jgi:hypothetical protein
VGIRYTTRYAPVTPVTSVTGVIMASVISALLNKNTSTTQLRVTDAEPCRGARIGTRTIPIDGRTPRQISVERCQRSDALRQYAAFTLEATDVRR